MDVTIKILDPVKLTAENIQSLSAAIVNALSAASNPSADNPFATMADVGGESAFTEDQKAAIDGADEPSAENVFMTVKGMLLTIQLESDNFTIPVNSDTQAVIRYTGADDITVALNNDLIEGKVYTIRQAGAGVVTLAAETDEVLTTLDGLKTAGQNASIQFYKAGDKLIDTIGGVS